MPDTARLHELFIYEADTGLLRWRVTRGPRAAGSVAGYRHPSGYILVEFDGACTSAHRIIWCMVTAEWPIEIDHINLIKDDNRWENLREATHRENSRNRPTRSDNILGIKGVDKQRNGRYRARIVIDDKLRTLGTFATASEASEAYQAAAEAAHKEFYRGRPT